MVDSRGTGDGGRACLMKEVDEEDSRGVNAAVRTPEHTEDGPSDMGAVNGWGGKAYDCSRVLLDIEEPRRSGDEDIPHRCSRTE